MTRAKTSNIFSDVNLSPKYLAFKLFGFVISTLDCLHPSHLVGLTISQESCGGVAEAPLLLLLPAPSAPAAPQLQHDCFSCHPFLFLVVLLFWLCCWSSFSIRYHGQDTFQVHFFSIYKWSSTSFTNAVMIHLSKWLDVAVDIESCWNVFAWCWCYTKRIFLFWKKIKTNSKSSDKIGGLFIYGYVVLFYLNSAKLKDQQKEQEHSVLCEDYR